MNRFRWLSTAVLAMLLSSSALASKCSVGADVSFAPNSVAVDAESLEKLLEPIRRVQKENTVLAYVAAGHTDKSEAIGEKAKLLSLARAGVVAAHVVRHYPALANVVHIAGYGSTQPVSADAFKNRRVEVELTCIVPPPYFDKDGKPIL